jgi:hypothetical protein
MAATSTMNNHVRIFEDTVWCVAFTLMIVAGLCLKRLAGFQSQTGYALFALAGLCGWLWKAIGLVKRIFMVKEPVWFFDVTRETLEGLTGLILALAFIVLAISLKQVYRRQVASPVKPSHTDVQEPTATIH